MLNSSISSSSSTTTTTTSASTFTFISVLSIASMKMRFLSSLLSSFSLLLLSILSIGAMPSAEAFIAVPADPLYPAAPGSSNAALRKYIQAAQILPAAYSHCLTHHHLATECVTAACMAGVGDWLAQRKNVSKSWNARRSLHFVLKGLGEGFMWSFWYHKADIWVAASTHWALAGGMAPSMGGLYKTMLSLILDLCIACPLIYGLWDIPFPALLQGVPLRQIPRQIRNKLGEMMWASLKLWTPVNVIIYNSPLKYRVLLMATADVFWQSIVSAIATRDLIPDEEKGEIIVPARVVRTS